MGNYPVTNTDFTLTKNVRNEILFFVKDIDRHPVTNATMAAANIVDLRIIVTDPNTLGNSALLLGSNSIPMGGDDSVLIPAPGIDLSLGAWYLILSGSDISDWPLGFLQYSILADTANGTQTTFYTDRNYSTSGTLRVIDGPFPEVPEATSVVFSNAVSGAYQGAASIGNLSNLQSAVINCTGFMGNVSVQATMAVNPTDSDWSLAEVDATSSILGNLVNGNITFNSVAVNGPIYLSINGNYTWVRFTQNTISGSFDSIDFRAD